MPKTSQTPKTNRIGGVYLHGRTYYAQWMHNGKRYKVNTKQTDESKALAELDRLTQPFRLTDDAETAKLLADRAATEFDRLPALRVRDLWGEVEKTVKFRDWAAETQKRNRTHVEKFAAWLSANHPETVEVRDVSEEQARDFIVYILGTNKPKTAIEYRGILLQVWKMTAHASRAKSNPWESVERPVKRSERRRELTLDELRKIFDGIGGEMRTLFAIGLYTGLRLGDAVTLKWESIDLAARTIRVTPAKTERHGTEVAVSIAGTALESILDGIPAEERSGYVVPALAEKYRQSPTGNAGFGKMIQKVFIGAGIATNHESERGRKTVDVGFHSLRHTFVSLSANAGVPLAVVQSIVGHTSTAMTQHYYHTSKSALERAAKALPNVLGGDSTTAAGNAVETALDALVTNWTDEQLEQSIRHLREILKRRKG